MIYNYTNFHKIYIELLTLALEEEPELNLRTNHCVRTIPGGISFKLDISDGIIPTPGVRRVYPKSAAAEVAWFLTGLQDITFLQQYTKMWNKFTEGDGQTVKNSYGYRWRRHFHKDQIAEVIQLLKEDPSSRQAMVQVWDPRIDGLISPRQKNIPCPTNFTFNIVGKKLHTSYFLRSSDLFVGLPYDIMGHFFLTHAIATELNILPGTMHITLAHAHLYEDHREIAYNTICNTPVIPPVIIESWSISEITNYPDKYVLSVSTKCAGFVWSNYDPKPVVIE